MHVKSAINESDPRNSIQLVRNLPSKHHLLIESKQQEPSHVTIPITVFYALLFLFGIFANSLSILMLLKNGRMKSSAVRFYLLSLAMADLVLLLTIPVTVYRYYWQYYPWLLSNLLCKLYFMIRHIYCATTSWTIIVFTAERYIAICHPMWSITGLRQSRMIHLLAVIWVLSAVSSVPFAIVYGQSTACILDYTATSRDKTVFSSTVCEMTEKEPFTIYKTVVQVRSILCFLVPLTVIIIFHLLIFRHLSVNRRLWEGMGLTHLRRGQYINSSEKLCRTERKVLQLMGAVAVAFFVCNFPDTAASLMHIYTENWTTNVHTIYTWLKSYLSMPLWYVNSALDPILFCISSSSFRCACKDTLGPILPWINSSLKGHKLQVSCISLTQSWTRNQLAVSSDTHRAMWTPSSCTGELPNSCDAKQRRALQLLSLKDLSKQNDQQVSYSGILQTSKSHSLSGAAVRQLHSCQVLSEQQMSSYIPAANPPITFSP
ncbi:neuromedin-U receptor 2-like [Pristis pectinata]|uniref:neuromedin-U receptor 2-like n=1 Tax=Pristis pectinata TaxID=685728 RepID=UPI00223D3E2B|nr:neuromedin-U receptor 2-like [Pristis pectinata]